MVVKVRIEGIPELTRDLDELGRSQIPFATVLALTRTGEKARGMLYGEFRRKFDRPTSMVMGSLYLEPATKQKLSAMVWMKDKPLGGKNPHSMEEILEHHFRAGRRLEKALEKTLKRLGFIKPGEWIVPGKAARLDQYGNMSRGQVQQIYAQIGVAGRGYDNQTTDSRRSQRNKAKAGAIFWSWGPNGAKEIKVDAKTGIAYGHAGGRASHLPKGAWVRDGRNVHPILIVVSKAPTYKKLFDLDALGREAVSRHFDAEFKSALAVAIKTAGKLSPGASREQRRADWRSRAFG